MVNNFSVLQGGLGTSPFQDRSVSANRTTTYTIYPMSPGTSTNISVALPVTQSLQPTWVASTASPTGWIVTNQLQYAITFNGASNVYYKGVPVCVFDCPRTTAINFNPGTTANCSITINGWDEDLREVVEQIPNYIAGSGNITASKPIKLLRSIYFSAYPFAGAISDTNTITVQGSQVYGLPYFINTINSVSSINWNSTAYSIQTVNTFPIVVAGVNWRLNGITPINGLYPNVASSAKGVVDLRNGAYTAPNGSIPLTIEFYIYGNDTDLSNKLSNYVAYQRLALSSPTRTYNFSGTNYTSTATGNTLVNTVKAVNNASGIVTYPSLVEQDLIGAQFPADLGFITAYNKAKLA